VEDEEVSIVEVEEYEGPDDRTILRMILSLVVTLVIVVAGAVWTWKIGQKNNQLFHKLSHVREEASGLRETWNETPDKQARM
jgi:hypothetical protein